MKENIKDFFSDQKEKDAEAHERGPGNGEKKDAGAGKKK